MCHWLIPLGMGLGKRAGTIQWNCLSVDVLKVVDPHMLPVN